MNLNLFRMFFFKVKHTFFEMFLSKEKYQHYVFTQILQLVFDGMYLVHESEIAKLLGNDKRVMPNDLKEKLTNKIKFGFDYIKQYSYEMEEIGDFERVNEIRRTLKKIIDLKEEYEEEIERERVKLQEAENSETT